MVSRLFGLGSVIDRVNEIASRPDRDLLPHAHEPGYSFDEDLWEWRQDELPETTREIHAPNPVGLAFPKPASVVEAAANRPAPSFGERLRQALSQSAVTAPAERFGLNSLPFGSQGQNLGPVGYPDVAEEPEQPGLLRRFASNLVPALRIGSPLALMTRNAKPGEQGMSVADSLLPGTSVVNALPGHGARKLGETVLGEERYQGLPEGVRRGYETLPYFLLPGPTGQSALLGGTRGVAGAAASAAATGAGGEITERLGLGRTVGEQVGPALAGGLVKGAEGPMLGVAKKGKRLPPEPVAGTGATPDVGPETPRTSAPGASTTAGTPAPSSSAEGVPPARPPGGGVATLEPPPEGPTIPPVKKLAEAIKNAGKTTPEQQRMFAQERARRTAISASVLERGQGPTAFKRAKAVAGGEFGRPSFEVPPVTADDVFSLTEDIRKSDLLHWQKINAENALTDVLSGRIPQPAEKEMLRRVFGKDGDDLLNALSAKRGLGEKIMAEVWGGLGLPQALQTTYDISSRFRQGMVLGWSNPHQWANAWRPALKSFATEDGFNAALKGLERDPWIGGGAGDMAGYSFSEVGGHLYSGGRTLSGLERANPGLNESYISRFIQKVPGVRASERDFAMFLDQLGGKTYSKYADTLWQAGERDIDQYKALAKVINHARGYGDFSVGQVAKGFNAFYSGRNLVSRFQVVLDPILQPGSMLKPSARQLAAKNLVGMITGDLAVLGMIGGVGGALGLGLSVEMDPRSTDWGKVRVGNTRIDPWAGFAPMVRLIARGVTGETKSETGGFYPARFQSELLRFFRNKQSPIAGMVVDQLLGQTTIGEKPQAPWDPKKLAEMLTPFWTQDVMDAAKETGLGMSPIVAPLAMTGFGTSSYSTPSQKRDEAVIAAIKAGETYKDAQGRDRPLPTTYRDAQGKDQPIRLYADLKAADPLAAEAFDKAHADKAKAVQDKQNAQAQAIRDIQDEFANKYAANDALLKTNPGKWREQRAELRSEERNQLIGLEKAPGASQSDLKPRNRLDQINKAYDTLIKAATDETGRVKWDKVDAGMAGWPEEDLNLLYSQKLRGESPASREFITAQRDLRPYFDVRDEAWRQLAAKNHAFAGYESYDDFRQSRVEQLMEKNPRLSRTIAETEADRLLKPVEKMLGAKATAYLAKHKDLVLLLDKFGYYVPAALRPLTLQGVNR